MYAVLMKQMLYLKMLAWLEDNIYCNPAIDDLAQYMGYSRRFVYDVFYQYGQLPIGQYIRLRRLTIAAVSLRLTRQPIAAIAWQLSYDSPQTFSREFKKRFSLSPREYRCAAHWDTAKLLKKFHPDGESLPLARFFSLPEQVYYGYPMKYELRLSDLVLQSTAKTSISKRLTVFSPLAEARFPYFPTTPRRAKMSLTSRLTLLSAVMRRESCPPRWP
ncbi:AraC family transcriptional regulator [Klebsiella pneumoniae]|nr:AraC family transcriptional regulator [Klebsiella pneumoniae]VVK67953.1 Right origin-binding protein [Klebsiella pneumoniae]